MRRLAWICAITLILGCNEADDVNQDSSPANTSLTGTGPHSDPGHISNHKKPMGDPAPRSKAPMYITTMTHLEGAWDYSGKSGEKKFELDVKKIQTAMDSFDAYGALLTIESEISFSTAAKDFNSDIFDQLMARGHGVGTHCDITPDAEVIPVEEFSQEFLVRKQRMDDLVGAENNLGCSGGQGRNDWILGAHLAGFKYICGVVGFAYLSMDEDQRPPDWTDEYILEDGHFHDNIPVDLAERIHPFMMDDATDMVADVPGKVLMSSGGLGRLDSFADSESGVSCAPNCSLDEDDVDAAFRKLDEAIALHDTTRIGKVDIYFPLSIFNPTNLPYIADFLSRLKTDYIDTGKLTWSTQRGIYENYAEWNNLE